MWEKGGIIYALYRSIQGKKISTYALLKNFHFSRGTLDSLKQARNISTATLNDLCNILQCKVEEVLIHIQYESFNRSIEKNNEASKE